MLALEKSWGGEIFVPKIPSYRILDVAEAISPGSSRKVVGIRPGEKLHEEMITETDGLNTVEFDGYYVIIPSTPIWNVDEFKQEFRGELREYGFSYASNTNSQWLSVEELRELIRQHIDPGFSPA